MTIDDPKLCRDLVVLQTWCYRAMKYCQAPQDRQPSKITPFKSST